MAEVRMISPVPPVSVVMPVRDEEQHVAAALDSVLSQDYPGQVEVIVADGSDRPFTSDVVRRYGSAVRWISNSGRTISRGVNAAVGMAAGEIIVRCDARTVLPPGYLRRVVETIGRTRAANVGGRLRPFGTTCFEKVVALAMSTRLGAGAARYRIGGPEGPADTVCLGAYRREALAAVGGYDSTLPCAEDYDLNVRLRRRGETVWFDPRIEVFYRPRGTLAALARQYFRYGRWKRVVLRRHPAFLQPRHFGPPLLLAGMASSVVLALAGASAAAAAPPLAYCSSLAAGSLVVAFRRGSPAAALLLPVVLMTMHLSWAVGFATPVCERPLPRFLLPVRGRGAAARAVADERRPAASLRGLRRLTRRIVSGGMG